MKALIYDTSLRAKSAAKRQAIRQAEKTFGLSYSTSYEKKLKLNKNWLIEGTSVRCVCGETGGIITTLFHKNQQFTSIAGYCDSCGHQHPMP
jgi:hypothetical protein